MILRRTTFAQEKIFPELVEGFRSLDPETSSG